jgi:putative oxidoreductase
MDIGLLLLRLVVGLTVAAHGGQKLFGWFGGHGLAGSVAGGVAVLAGLVLGGGALAGRRPVPAAQS